ncbi:bifunctional oligoribonuclease/PAP phosphatase NrnA [Solihabitans fulvus]|uniref:Bifunctional oligoribonuclease/PAP phosphatase NrnA n=1 Tax=Solihabitans fulvus TaxID=1892852 RepID=A0A5B2X6L2_9PSEU|nr:DHH family phosphoesterase [Solihabitans fulvus]KAA2258863.1 bifunctional oligoribonuclease/PAP phosphatase NrnA [Solihabitans fulvus]
MAGQQTSAADLRAAVALLGSATDVTLLAHVNPDADALGSALAVGLALHRRGARVRVSFGYPDEVPETLRGLDVAGLLVPAAEVPAAPPLLVAMDTGSLGRLGPLRDRVAATVAAGGEVLVVDHHVSNTRFGTTHLVDHTAEATAVLALRLLDELGEVVDEPIARCIYAGLVTDTRSFRHASPETHQIAARLLAAGVDAESTTRLLMDTHPFGWLGMLSSVLGRARLEPASARGLGLVHAVVRLADADGLRAEELESVVDVVRTTAEAEVAAVLKELSPQHWSVSLRAVGRLDVRAAAEALGGGGHTLAAGFTADGPEEQVIDELRAALDTAPLISSD